MSGNGISFERAKIRQKKQSCKRKAAFFWKTVPRAALPARCPPAVSARVPVVPACRDGIRPIRLIRYFFPVLSVPARS